MIDFTDAPKLKKGYGGANGNKISILLSGSRWMLKFPSISERSPELHYTTSSIKINGRRINYFNFLSSLENDGCNRALERMLPRIDMSKINNIIWDTPGIDQAEKEFYTGIIKARKEAILDYSADLLSREKGIVILTKEFKRMPDRSLASKDISSTEAAKKLAEAKNSRASKDETLNKLNIKAVEDSHLDDSSNTSCL